MAFYDDMQAIAKEVLTDFNQGVIVLTKLAPGSGPPENPGAPTPTNYTLTGAVSRGVALKYVTAGLAIMTDKQITTATDQPKAAMTDTITVDGVVCKFIQIIQIPDAGTPVAYVYIVRAGA